ncbi:arginine--tRNA ligase [Candidatus Pacearchaeota archaeon]|nr:arginine--tRNA ligase [Candidatus Pacearchaeota archaeon]
MKQTIVQTLIALTNLNKQEIENLIEIPPSPDLGDYAFPCFVLAKQLKKNPNEIAQELSKKISPQGLEKVEAKGPYINFFLDKTNLANETLNKIKKEKNKYGSQKIKSLVLIETPGPNTNKPLHLGHVRNIILGQAIKNLLEFSGNEVKIVNINNDRGIHICKSLVAYEKFGKNATPQTEKIKSDHLVGDFYVKYAKELEKNKDLEKEVQDCLQKWEAGNKKTLSLWKKMNSWAYKGFNETYKKFDLKIDKHYYESKIYKRGKEIVLEQFKRGNVQKKLDGAYFVDLSKEELGEKILLRADGTSIYITQDLYLALQRKKEFNFDKLIHVVASEQDHHFKVLFTLLKKFGYKWAENLHHLSYGLVHLESGRMKSREGTVIDADDLILDLEKLAEEELIKRYPKLSKKEKKKRIKAISMSAIRYYFLRTDRMKDVVFIPEKSISFEGNTGPYLLYTYARARSIIRKAKNKSAKIEITLPDQEEKNLLIMLDSFPTTVKKAYDSLAPNIVANYAYQLAQKFNEFYHVNKVIGSDNENFRLLLVDAFSRVLKNSLKLLHIETLEEM